MHRAAGYAGFVTGGRCAHVSSQSSVITMGEMKSLSLHRHEFQGDWNYEVRPRTSSKPTKHQSAKLAS